MLSQKTETINIDSKNLTIWRGLLVFVLGAACFLITQVFTRVPLLGWIQKQPGFILWAVSVPLLSGILIALTAGLFEEVGRFAIKALALKPARSQFWEPIVFGLGHGICEAVWVFSSAWGMLALVQPSQLVLPIIERLLAITMHIGFSVTIWNGFQHYQRIKYLLIAILAHGLVDAAIPLAGRLGWGVLQLESLFALFATAMIIYVVYSKKYYQEKENYEEK